MEKGSMIVNVSSMSAYMLPNMLLPTKKYSLIFNDEEKFLKKMVKRAKLFGSKMESNLGYPISKNFVCWLTKRFFCVLLSKFYSNYNLFDCLPLNFW